MSLCFCQVTQCTPVDNIDASRESESSPDNPIPTPRKKKVRNVERFLQRAGKVLFCVL